MMSNEKLEVFILFYYFPYVLQIDVTPRCNLNCLHCRTSHGVQNEMPVEKWIGILDPIFAAFPGLIHWVAIGGGEPTLYPNLIKLIEYLKNKTRIILLMTNGVLIAENPTLLDNLINVGLNRVQLSLESPNKEIHNQIRGSGNFDIVMKATQVIINRKIKLAFRMTLNGLNYQGYADFIKLCKNIGADEANLRRVIPVGNASKNFSWDCIPEKDYIDLLENFPKLEKKIGIYVNSEDPYRFLFHPNFSRRACITGMSLRGCPAGTMHAYINPEGMMRPCSNIPYILGDLKKESFLKIWNKHSWMIKLRERNYENCKKCKYKNICGGCRAIAQHATGDWWGIDPTCFINSKYFQEPRI